MVRDTLSSLKAQGEDQPSAIVLHILTNELKSKDPESCVSELQLIASEYSILSYSIGCSLGDGRVGSNRHYMTI